MVDLATSSTLNGGSITIVVEWDNDGDGTQDNSETESLSGGSETISLSSTPDDASQYRIDTEISGQAMLQSAELQGFTTVPTAPSNLAASEDAGRNVDLSWDDNSSGTGQEDEFRIYRAESSGTTTADYTQITTVGTDVTSYEDSESGVEDGETYHYRVTAYNSAGESDPSNEASVVTTLPAPTLDSVTQGSADDEIDLAWTKNDDSSDGEWQVYRSSASSPSYPGDYSQVASGIAPATTTYSDTGLTHGETYSYFVRRVANSIEQDSGTASQTTALPAPTWNSLTAQSDSQIDLDWSKEDNSSDGSYEIYHSTDGTLGSLVATISDLTTTTYSDTGLTEGTQYYYTVRRVTTDAETNSTQNSETTPPTAPSGLTSLWNNEVQLTWTDNSGNEDGFYVHKSTTDSPSFPGDYSQEADLSANSTSYDDTSVSTADTYHYAVTAYVSSTESSETADSITLAEITVTATTELPDAQTPSLGNGVEDEIAVDWTDVTDNGSYRIQARETGESTWDNNATGWYEATEGEATISHTIGSREDGEEYEVRMRTETTHVTGSWTTPTSIVTKFPGATSASIADTHTTEIDLTWTDNSDNEDGFKVRRKREYDYGWQSNWDEVGDLAANTTSYTDSTVSPGTKYKYEIRAYTEHTSADSNETSSTTTNTLTVDQENRIQSTGWYVEVVHDGSGAVHRPSVIGDPQINPTVNGFPRLTVPVPRDEKWEDSGFEDAAIRVWKDGQLQPVDTLVGVSQRESKTDLEARGGQELLERVQASYTQQDAHTAAENLIKNNTTYTANVDAPATSTDENVPLQEADSTQEFNSTSISVPDDQPIRVNNNKMELLQCAETEESGDVSDKNVVSTGNSNSSASGGTETYIGFDGQYISYSWTPQYDIPAGDAIPMIRMRTQDKDYSPAFDVFIDGVKTYSVGTQVYAQGDYNWFTDTNTGSNTGSTSEPPAISAGSSVSVKIEITAAETDSNGDNVLLGVDMIGWGDSRQSYTFDNTTDADGWLSGPEFYPQTYAHEFKDVASGLQITGGRARVTMDDTSNGQELALSTDQGGTWLTSSNTSTFETDFNSGTTQLRGRVTFARYGSRSTSSPTTGFKGQTLSDWGLDGDLDNTPILVDRSFDNRLIDVLSTIAEDKNFVFEIRVDNSGNWSVEWCQPGQRTSGENGDIINYEVRKQTEDKAEKATVYGSSKRVREESFTSNHGTWVALNYDDIVESSEVVYESSSGTQYDRGDDYEMDYQNGQIRTLSTGAMSDSTTYEINYQHKVKGVWEAAGINDPIEIVEHISGLNSDLTCEQLAYYIVDKAKDPIWEATMTVPKQPTGWDVIDEIDPDEVPGDGLQIREIDESLENLEIRLASRRTTAGIVDNLRGRVTSVTKRL